MWRLPTAATTMSAWRVSAPSRRRAVADRDRRVGVQQQHRHRLADDVAAPDHDGVLAARVAADRLEHLHAAVGRAGLEARAADHQRAGARDGKAVDVLGGEIAPMTLFASICAGSGNCTRMPWIAGSAFSAAMRASRSASAVSGAAAARVQAGLLAILDLVLHVDLRRRVRADQDHGEAGRTPRAERRRAAGDVGADASPPARCRR